MRSACAIGLSLAFLFAGAMARAQQAPSPAKLAPTTAAFNKTTCEKSVAKIGTPAPTMTTAGLFAAMDVNKDGKIDPTEFKGPNRAFAWVDTDHDGYITRPEARRAYLTIVGLMAIDQRKSAFKAMDENKDGNVSLSEYRGPTRAFARIDVNHDGVITPEEAKHAFQASVDHFVVAIRFKALDTNHDGKISAAEFKGPKAAFAKYSDKNGKIGRAEFAKMIHARVAARPVATAKPVPTPPKLVVMVTKTDVVKQVSTTSAPKRVAPAAHAGGLNRILAMDANKDGKVGMGEYFKAVEARFVWLDQDKDGYITASDLEKVAALRKTKGTSTPVAGAPAKTPVKPATLKPAKPAAVNPGRTASKPLAAAVLPSQVDVSFDQIDSNHDGVLTRAEIKVYFANQPHKNVTTTASHHKG
ncbi:MAG: EF-hand domain-containing protein [Isosphaeraceae bacterium]